MSLAVTSLPTVFHMGLDDTDSLEGSCTTYITTLIIEKISNKVNFIDFPRLIRNNPNIPWKTRGNGSLALTFETDEKNIEQIISVAVETINNNYKRDINTNPGLVIVKDNVPPEIMRFAKKALVKVVKIEEALYLAKRYSYFYYGKGNKRGLIGALSAIGNKLDDGDYTFELLTYRSPQNIGSKRKLVKDSVYKMDNLLKPYVFNNFDEDRKNVIIAPAGKDPVLYGIRGENPLILLKAMNIVKVEEEIERYCIFRSNQGTDQHFKYADSILEENTVFVGEIEISKNPWVIPGGHVFLQGKINNTKEEVCIAAFEPTKSFRRVVESLRIKDRIYAYGGVKYNDNEKIFTIQLEKCEVLHLEDQYKEISPLCPKCGKRMTSAGKNKGFKCKHCGFKGQDLVKEMIPIERKIKLGLYIPPAGAQRHLVKPLRRYTVYKKDQDKTTSK